MDKITKRFAILRSGVSKGLKMVTGASGVQTLPDDLKIYNSLQPKDFETLVRRFGETATLSYIREMEVERIGKQE